MLLPPLSGRSTPLFPLSWSAEINTLVLNHGLARTTVAHAQFVSNIAELRHELRAMETARFT